MSLIDIPDAMNRYETMSSSAAKRRRIDGSATADASQHGLTTNPKKGATTHPSPRRGPNGIEAFKAPSRRKILSSDRVSAAKARQRNGETEDINEEIPEEPELPPTPTQLGLDPPPTARPTGLLSSSSPSGRRTRRTSDYFQSSSLVVENTAQIINGDGDQLGKTHKEELLGESVLKRQGVRDELSARKQRLKDSLSELEEMLESLGHSDGDVDMERLKNIMCVVIRESIQTPCLLIFLFLSRLPEESQESSADTDPPLSSLISSLLPFSPFSSEEQQPKLTRRTTSSSSTPTNTFALEESSQAKPYLQLFAPLAIASQSSETSIAPDSSGLTQTTRLMLTSPPPFPPTLYKATITYKTDLLSQSLLSVSVSKESTIPKVLQNWIDTRLSNPLLKLDISTLSWGINRYWEAAVYRAQLWTRLEMEHLRLVHRPRTTQIINGSNQHPVLDAKLLVPHFERTTMLFTSAAQEKSPKILLSCQITLDQWTGEPRLQPEISIDNIPEPKIEHETKKLFWGLLDEKKVRSKTEAKEAKRKPDVVVRAMRGVLGVLFDD